MRVSDVRPVTDPVEAATVLSLDRVTNVRKLPEKQKRGISSSSLVLHLLKATFTLVPVCIRLSLHVFVSGTFDLFDIFLCHV